MILIVCLIAFAAGFALGTFLYRALKKIKQVKIERDGLLKKIDWLKKELDRYKDGNLKIELTLPERRIILNALEFSQYKARVQEPETKRFIRIIYNTLRRKIKETIKE